MPADPNRVQTTIYLPRDLNTSLKELARIRGKNVSQLSVDLLHDSLRREVQLVGTTYLMPEIRAALEKNFSELEKEFVRLLARAATDSGATKRLVLEILFALRIATPEEVIQMEEKAWRDARKSLHGPLEGIDALLASFRSKEEG